MTESQSRECQSFLGFLAGAEGRVPSTLVVAAHPDDEVIGLGGQLPRLKPRVHVLQVTDGAPRDMQDAAAHGFESRQAYADARRRELLTALALAGIGREQTTVFGIPDQQASLDLAALSRRLAELITWLRPECVLVPAYEGGHPDHDAVAFAVWAARAVLRRAGLRVPIAIEFPLYHAGPAGQVVTARFAGGGPVALVVRLSEQQQQLKRRMVACFGTQQAVLSAFCLDVERFRCAPERDFLHSPHAGPTHYDRQPWGMDSASWQEHAHEALAELELLPGGLVPA
jgi:LmbE family N-acetylglucosaminyl deacetylase